MKAWHDPALDAAVAELADDDVTPACTVLAEARDDPEVRSLRVEVLADELIGSGRQIIGMAMDDVNAELSLLAGAVAVREARVIADGARDHDAARMTHAYLRRSVGPLNQAAELLAADPVPHDLLQFPAAVLTPAERDSPWDQVLRRAPRLFSAHRTRIDLMPAEQGLAFARATARAAGSGDPRIALVAYAHLRLCSRLAATHREAGKTEHGAELHARWEYFGASARTEIAALSERFLAAARPHPRTPQAHILFAAAFAAMSLPALAEPHRAALNR